MNSYEELITNAKHLEDYVIDNEARLNGYFDSLKIWDAVALSIQTQLGRENKRDEWRVLHDLRRKLTEKHNEAFTKLKLKNVPFETMY